MMWYVFVGSSKERLQMGLEIYVGKWCAVGLACNEQIDHGWPK
jgi:hypothetical protein